MALAGIIQSIIGTGTIEAVSQDGQTTRALVQGSEVYVGETLVTKGDVSITLVDGQGNEIAALGGDTIRLIDETIVAEVAPEDSTVQEAAAIQTALEQGDQIPDDAPAAGEPDPFQGDALGYYQGDHDAGGVNPRGLGIDPPGEPENIHLAQSSFTDIEPEAPSVPPEPAPPEPEPLFVVGSNPEPSRGEGSESEYSTGPGYMPNDIEGSTTTHAVPGTQDSGQIIGGEGGDLLVGDPGAYGLESAEYILVMDLSGSMVPSLEDLQGAAKSTIQNLYDQVAASDAAHVRINLMTFSSTAGDPVWIEFSKDPVSGEISVSWNLGGADQTGVDIIGIDTINNWVDSLVPGGDTNYGDALVQADAIVNGSSFGASYPTHVIFITDGLPDNWDYMLPGHELDTLKGDLVGYGDSIRAVGIGMGSLAGGQETLNDIDTTGGNAIIIDTAAELNTILPDLVVPSVYFSPVGDDQILGGEDNDIIFGDVLNTDGVLADLADQGVDVSDMPHLPDGSGWQVFTALENSDGWDRGDTINYIQNHHDILAQESLDSYGDHRYGGYDDIQGGAGDDIIYGQEGNDTISGGDGDDIISGGTGDDIIDGGDGHDTLLVTEASLDFSNLSDTLDNIEAIHLGDDGAGQTITKLTAQDVLDLSQTTDNLVVEGGGSEDSVVLDSTDGWAHDVGTNSFVSGGAEIHAFNVSVNLDGDVKVFDDAGNDITP